MATRVNIKCRSCRASTPGRSIAAEFPAVPHESRPFLHLNLAFLQIDVTRGSTAAGRGDDDSPSASWPAAHKGPRAVHSLTRTRPPRTTLEQNGPSPGQSCSAKFDLESQQNQRTGRGTCLHASRYVKKKSTTEYIHLVAVRGGILFMYFTRAHYVRQIGESKTLS